MNAFFILMALVSQQSDYQVFMIDVGYAGIDCYGNGIWGDPDFEVDGDNAGDPNINGQMINDGFEFNYPLVTGYDDDLWFEKGVTYSVRLAEGEWGEYQIYTINQWFTVDEITVPSEPSAEWADSISIQYMPVTVSWRLIDDDTLRFRFVNQSSSYDEIFMVFPIPGSQDLSPTTWGSVKSSF